MFEFKELGNLVWLEFAKLQRSAGMISSNQSFTARLSVPIWAFLPIFTTSIWMVYRWCQLGFPTFSDRPISRVRFPSPQVVSCVFCRMVGSRPKILTVSLRKMAGVTTPHFPNHFASVGRFIDSQVTVITVIPIPESDKDENNPILISLEKFGSLSPHFRNHFASPFSNPSSSGKKKTSWNFPWVFQFHPIFPHISPSISQAFRKGTGPESGWVSIQISGKELARRTAAPLEDDLEDEAPEGTSELQWQIQKRCNKENDWLARLAALGWGFLETFFF